MIIANNYYQCVFKAWRFLANLIKSRVIQVHLRQIAPCCCIQHYENMVLRLKPPYIVQFA